MKKAAEHRKIAREVLKGNWGKAIAAFALSALLGGSYLSGIIQIDMPTTGEMPVAYTPFSGTVALNTQTLLLVLFLMLLFFGLGPAAQLGYARFRLNMMDGKESRVSQVLEGYAWFWKALGLQLLIALRLVGLLFLFMIPVCLLIFALPGTFPTLLTSIFALGMFLFLLYFALGYSQAMFVLADQPNLAPSQAIRESIRLMNGQRWRLFCLEFSFIGWLLLHSAISSLAQQYISPSVGWLFSLIFLTLFLNPYMMTTDASFYREMAPMPEKDLWQPEKDVPMPGNYEQ